MKNYYEYEVEMFEEFQVKTYQGITYGNDFAEALRNVADYYGEEDLNSVKNYPLGLRRLYCFEQERS